MILRKVINCLWLPGGCIVDRKNILTEKELVPSICVGCWHTCDFYIHILYTMHNYVALNVLKYSSHSASASLPISRIIFQGLDWLGRQREIEQNHLSKWSLKTHLSRYKLRMPKEPLLWSFSIPRRVHREFLLILFGCVCCFFLF